MDGMKPLSRIVALGLVLFCLGAVTDVFLSETNAETLPARVLRPVFSKIRQAAHVPILLPSRLPASVNERKIHYTTGNTTPQGYEISLYYREGCGDACSAGYFEAKRGDSVSRNEVDRVVQLTRGIKGYYTARSCGGSCTPPQINWTYKGVLYTIQFNVNNKSKRADQAEIIALANSAILGGER